MNGRALVAWNLRRLRTERGVSQERLAADAGVDRAYISELERELGNASVDMLDKLASVLDVTVAEFLTRPPEGYSKLKAMTPGRKPKST
ncbi:MULTISPECIES: helix-turn-helix domain-containing protein [Brevundimonas]|uniref:Helix-turn-helix transcriptional regulator n=1 Tax=Brevundimonas fontaquae TaxID=2813778 RepID=A0ABX7LQB3_9CAUL|nr:MULTISPECIES: helix-turn-helix transcriptional regulator [Brevundimonas]MBC1183836.1 helix-turn-helix transcriptional regulator [Brevundimonas huaxiensis]QSF54472.1 helix-turn-helix transcriptional regulator [Brevundimonas fontaquae]